MAPKKEKIAILGGGVGGMATAFELTEGPNQDKYEITLYQMGWRLGGKGASGRNRKLANRIQEHGLHVWLGFYENAFHTIRKAYQEAARKRLVPDSDPNGPYANEGNWQKAFTPEWRSTSLERFSSQWQPWPITMPRYPGHPGEEEQADPGMRRVGRLWHLVFGKHKGGPIRPHEYIPFILWRLLEEARGLSLPSGVKVLRRVLATLFSWLLHLLLIVAYLLSHFLRAESGRLQQLFHWLLLSMVDIHFHLFSRKAEQHLEKNAGIRHFLYMLDLGRAFIRGMFKDPVLKSEGGFEELDKREIDLIEWFSSYGSQHCKLVLTPFYNGFFALENGDPGRRNVSAGTGLRVSLRALFTYRGDYMYWMNGGMGDVIFSPLYLVLAQRGVRFEFFHKVTNLGLDGSQVATIDLDVQATPKEPTGYQPLFNVKGVPCWPSTPFYSQLEQGPELQQGDELPEGGFDLESDWTQWKPVAQKQLRVGEDFDRVVLAISLAALPGLCSELIDAEPAWKKMVEHLKTVETQSVQLWLCRKASDLGCTYPIVGGYLEPYDTYANMNHLLGLESWQDEDNLQQIAYLCNTLEEDSDDRDNPAFPGSQTRRVFAYARKFLNEDLQPIWPTASSEPGEFDWSLLLDRSNQKGESRLEAQYLRANVSASERYVQSVKGSSQFRLRPGDTGFEILIIAGDWTYNVLNIGCVEAAVISGRLAAHAISGQPDFLYDAFNRRPKIEAYLKGR